MQYEPPDNRTIGETRGVCPAGWHIPTENEWRTMIDYLGGEAVAGGKLKKLGSWKAPNSGATNETGFNAFPSEYDIYKILQRSGHNEICRFWTASACDYSDNIWCRYMVELRYDDPGIRLTYIPADYNKDYALTVRCVKNNPENK
jgi:uncharacterized protein (TIGR02145 family)